MLFVYSLLYTLGMLLMSPLFLLRRQKYASGFSERLGNYPEFKRNERKVIWLHCVSVGEVNAARKLVDELKAQFPDHRLVVSTTTQTGQELAQTIFKDKADAVFYFPFDWKFSVRRALRTYHPSLILLMETEIWPRLITEVKTAGSNVAIVNGRLSQRSFRRYSKVRGFVRSVLSRLDLALVQTDTDAERLVDLGMDTAKIKITGNLKFESSAVSDKNELAEQLRSRFGITAEQPMIIAASTHEPEERIVLEALDGKLGHSCRLLIAPRHPERFDAVERLLRENSLPFVRRSSAPSPADKDAVVILLDSIGELRASYTLATVVFVGGSLIPHGGQSVLEPAAAGKAIVTGPYTANFQSVVNEFLKANAIRQISRAADQSRFAEQLSHEFNTLLENDERRRELGQNAAAIMDQSHRSATAETVDMLRPLLDKNESR